MCISINLFVYIFINAINHIFSLIQPGIIKVYKMNAYLYSAFSWSNKQ